ncbi:MAG: DUF6516 family protein [Candidatus Woesearchaeota archaeon]
MATVVFTHKHVYEDGDIEAIRILEVPKSEKQPEGVSYSLVYISKGERVIGYDNFEGHEFEGSSHHKHAGKRTMPYAFVDIWKLISDFKDDVAKLRVKK